MIAPAGKYYVGDPCYVFEEYWDYVIDATDCFEPRKAWFIELPNGKKGYIVGGGTYFGDGSYPGTNGYNYPVDAGLICAVSESLMELKGNGTMEEFDRPIEFSYEDGKFTFNELSIESNPHWEWDEEEWDWDEEDYNVEK
jgi:hypothetical protein